MEQLVGEPRSSGCKPYLRADLGEWGLGESATGWLGAHGLNVQPLAGAGDKTRSVILVGLPPEEERDLAHWTGLMERVARGSLAIFLDWAVFQKTYLSTSSNTVGRWQKARRRRCRPIGDRR